MSGRERRNAIRKLLSDGRSAVSGSSLAGQFSVSRQVIVQDIALLRANGLDVISTHRGYMLRKPPGCSRVFKVRHGEKDVRAELFAIVDCGGTVEDVFIYHRVYDTVRAKMGISSRREALAYLASIGSGKSGLLMQATSGYHYHTVTAKSEEALDMIQEKLQKQGFLAKLQEHEPVDFRNRAQ